MLSRFEFDKKQNKILTTRARLMMYEDRTHAFLFRQVQCKNKTISISILSSYFYFSRFVVFFGLSFRNIVYFRTNHFSVPSPDFCFCFQYSCGIKFSLFFSPASFLSLYTFFEKTFPTIILFVAVFVSHNN